MGELRSVIRSEWAFLKCYRVRTVREAMIGHKHAIPTLKPFHIIFAAASIIIPNKNFRNFEKIEILLVEEFMFGIRKSLHLRFVDLNLEFKVTLTPCQTCRIYHRGTLGRSLWQRSMFSNQQHRKEANLCYGQGRFPTPVFDLGLIPPVAPKIKRLEFLQDLKSFN